MRSKKVSYMRLSLVLGVVLAGLVGCNGTIVDNIISTQILGDADDADSTNPSQRYRGPADFDADDQRTKASSVQPKFNEVAGKAEAESLDPSANTVTGDEAVANSFNKVVSEFRVNINGNFTFDIVLDVDQVLLRHDGTVTIQVAAAILDKQGVAVQNGGIANVTLEFRRNARGTIDVIIAGDTTNPDSAQPNGDYNRTLSGPSGGIRLQAGTYRLELDLRIKARAPVQVGSDGQRHRAAVSAAKTTISLR